MFYTVGNPVEVTNADFFCSYSGKDFGLSENAKIINSAAYALIKDIPFAELGFSVAETFNVENVELLTEGTDLVANVQVLDNTSEPSVLTLIIAQYAGETLVTCSVKDVELGKGIVNVEESLSVPKDDDATSYRVFLWDADMKPLW